MEISKFISVSKQVAKRAAIVFPFVCTFDGVAECELVTDGDGKSAHFETADGSRKIVNYDDECFAVVGHSIYEDAYDYEAALGKMVGLRYSITIDSRNDDRKRSYYAETIGDAIALVNELYDVKDIAELRVTQIVERGDFKQSTDIRLFVFD